MSLGAWIGVCVDAGLLAERAGRFRGYKLLLNAAQSSQQDGRYQ